ncbi:glycosyl transferase family protein [Flammeovirgaceae bacterium 311]|nr:glycosyl transferase family protein [Flammeovirgaceae bacterium 311]
MKKILVFVDWYVPGYRAGGPIRSVKNTVDHLKEEAQFFVVTTDTDYQTTTPYPDITPDTWQQLDTSETVYYISAPQLHYKTIQRLLSKKKWDAVYLNGIYSWYFSILPLWLLRNKQIHKIVAPRGMLAEGALGVKNRKKKAFLALARLLGIFNGICFHATHPGEAAQIRKHIDKAASVLTVPNLPALQEMGEWKPRKKERGEIQIVSIARISPEKNTKFCFEILSNVAEGCSVIFHLYGPINDQVYWQECQHLMGALPPHVQVEFKGSIPNDKVAAMLTNYHLMFLPSLGENFGHIIVEALTSATPVLISDRTPWTGLEQKGVGWDISLNKPTDYSKIIEQLAQMDQQEYNLLSKSAYSFARGIHTNPDALQHYQRLFQL